MPELPDVEIYRRYIDATSLHRTVAEINLGSQLVQGTTPQTIRRHLNGAELQTTHRHGKHLFVGTGEGWLQLHFGMTGYLDATSGGNPPEHTELLLDFEDGHRLAYVNVRKLGSIMWVDDIESFVDQNDLGFDPLSNEIDQAIFDELLGSRPGSIKARLMNQSVIAGLGNVYTDEVLFQAGVHPESETPALDDDERGHLYREMMRVIDIAIERGADPEEVPDTWLLPHREPGSSCPRDGGEIKRIEVSGRSTYLCADHQNVV